MELPIDGTWQRRPSGLYLPPRRASADLKASRERPKITDWFQAIATILAVATAIPAIMVASFTYRDQQEFNRAQQVINHEQISMNMLTRAMNLQRFASRVSWSYVFSLRR